MPQIIKALLAIIFGSMVFGRSIAMQSTLQNSWSISVLPASIRLDPSQNTIIDHRFDAVNQEPPTYSNPLIENWIYDGEKVDLKGARGEYISFQIVLSNLGTNPLKHIQVAMEAFTRLDIPWEIKPELFLEWAVEVKNPSTGYPQASLGTGWYPDALIPYDQLQADSSLVLRRWTYPLELPDFNNRVDDQQSMIIWVDQYIPFDQSLCPPGFYESELTVSIGNESAHIPIKLEVWNFALPNANKFKASLQHEGFLSSMNESDALKIYQLFKRNRISLMDPTYKPVMTMSDEKLSFDWQYFDHRMAKYFSGEAFSSNFGYHYGPGYGEPIESFILPFNVQGKHGGRGWPDIGGPEEERQTKNRRLYQEAVQEVRSHLQARLAPSKTELTVYLNGLDESYFPEAWDRMVYYGKLFDEFYPEARFRIDGGYSEEAMAIVQHDIDSWASHTLNYDAVMMQKYQQKGIEDWLYGPMLYESKVNSWVGSSTFIDLPLINDRAISWASWKYRTYSWISWGIGAAWKRAWYDPETWKDAYKVGSDSDANFFYKKLNGNGMLIYGPGIVPNVREACPSIRLKAMRDGVQEYEYMRLLTQLTGSTDAADTIVNEIIQSPFGPNSIGNLDVWVYDAHLWDQARIKMGSRIHELSR
ncbi:MAG: DUF4091 domain-containing protein [Saprospiraceae bacterium]|nr:DUF4091 domain-containing protein [Saprospiraceae bacterium]